jgi:hypothetical protein
MCHGTCFAERHSMSDIDQLVWAATARRRAITHSTVGFVAVLLFALNSPAAQTQVILNEMPISATIEAYGNATTGVMREAASIRGQTPDAVSFDGAARVLARLATLNGPNIGLRVVAEASNHDARVSEVSILLFGSAGRLEIGKRMGLPDVLTGYAPNSFTFTTAEFGPPTGRTLDPGGGLQTQFLRDAVRARLEPLASHGVTASLFNDESTKILYVLPKHNGWLGGVSFATDAEDSRFDRLAQVGLVHESYWHQNVWRWGGTYAHARANQTGDGAGLRDLNSVSFGTSVTLDDSLDIGLSASYDGKSGTSRIASDNGASPAWGATVSLNYNTGPWTIGGYYQHARASASGNQAVNDRLSAFELGASYRFTTRLRVYGAWFLYDLTNDRRGSDPIAGSGSVFTLGLRATL